MFNSAFSGSVTGIRMPPTYNWVGGCDTTQIRLFNTQCLPSSQPKDNHEAGTTLS